MIVPIKELSSVRADHKNASIALRFGCYDILHAGHQAGIDFASTKADILVLGVMPDDYVSRVKGPDRPINPQETRVQTVDAAEGVDFSFIAPAGTIALAGIFMRLRPDVYVEDEEYGESRLKSASLSRLGVDYVIDRQIRIGSSSLIIASMGITGAIASSSLNFVMDNTGQLSR